ncbi:hypothetical protein APR12_004941 [Nocardia amikacinitolerans]|uniref:hypothetical protein n=1 Tax=Nocardia amikacinitolerans TaxID=756689 RepID=UPI00082AEFBF|nr:hypothetical protein [Nocardia amikacinitolerans]MCP2319572.1 hypothetical protein [Nocardia amikacinitolerans]
MGTVTIWTGAHVLALRTALRLKQRQLATAVKCAQRTVSFWECNPEKTVGMAFQAALDRLLEDADHGAQDRFREVIGEDDVKRRDFIAATGAAVGASVLRGAEAPTVTAEAIGHLRDTVHAAMLLDDKLGSNAAQPIIEAQKITCEALLRDCPTRLRPDLQSLTSEATASSAWAAWDQGRYQASDKLFLEAYDHAQMARSVDVAVGMMCHRTQLAIWTHRYQDAADFADVSVRLPVRDPRMADYVLLQAAQAYAYAGRAREAWPLLDRISGDHPEPTTPDKSYAYYMSDWLTGLLTSKSFEKAGETSAAVDTIETSIHRIPETDVRDRALALLHLAKLTAPDDLDRACQSATRALELAQINTSPRLREVYFDTRALLAPWAKSRAVRQLDEHAAEIWARAV